MTLVLHAIVGLLLAVLVGCQKPSEKKPLVYVEKTDLAIAHGELAADGSFQEHGSRPLSYGARFMRYLPDQRLLVVGDGYEKRVQFFPLSQDGSLGEPATLEPGFHVSEAQALGAQIFLVGTDIDGPRGYLTSNSVEGSRVRELQRVPFGDPEHDAGSSLLLDNAGKYLWVREGARLREFSSEPSGALKNTTIYEAPGYISDCCLDQTNRRLYLTCWGEGKGALIALSVTASGKLSFLQSLPVGPRPNLVQVDPLERRVYVQEENHILAFAQDASGKLGEPTEAALLPKGTDAYGLQVHGRQLVLDLIQEQVLYEMFVQGLQELRRQPWRELEFTDQY